MQTTMDPQSDTLVAEAALAAGVLDGFEHARAVAVARQRLFGAESNLQIGHYRIERRLGAGGMGEVYLAHDEHLDRKVAIKQVLACFTSEREQARLRSEARALAKLSHPNVVQVYEIGEHEERTFLAMEFVDGQTLAAWLREQPRSWSAVLERFIAAGQGLAAAHRAEVIHRDFKPDNVLLGREGSVRVADFGLALSGERRSAHTDAGAAEFALRSSVTGSIVGTIRYMALEQLLGDTVDARSDQFSFCVALYEALWGESPFELGSLEQRLDSLEAGQPKPPGRSRVPRGLWRVIRRGLARAAEDRWPDMPSLLAALDRAPRRRRRLIAATLAAPLLGLAIVGQGLSQRHARAEAEAACEAEGRSIDEDWNDGVRADLERAFSATGLEFAPTTWSLTRARMDGFVARWTELRTQTCIEAEVEHVRSESSRAQVAECLDEARTTFAVLASTWSEADAAMVTSATGAVAGLPVLATCDDGSWLVGHVAARADIGPRVAQLRARLDRVKALKLAVQFDRALADAREVLVDAEALGWQPLIAEARLALGDMQDRVGQYDEARTTMHRAFVEATESGHDFIALRASIGLTIVDGARLDRPESALEWGELAKALVERLELGGSMHEASTLHALGRAQRAHGELRAALATQRRVRALDEAVHGPDHPDVALSLNAIGSLALALGDVDEAQLAYEQALAIQRRTLGRAHPDTAWSLVGLARVAEASGDIDQALALTRAALQVEVAALGPNHVYVASTLDLLSAMLIRAGSVEEPLELRTRALAIREAMLDAGHPELGWSSIGVGDSLIDTGQPALGRAAFERARMIFESAQSADPRGLVAALAGAGEAELRAGRPDQAEPLVLRSLALAEALKLEPAAFVRARFVHAQLLWDVGARALAREQALLARSAAQAPGTPGRVLAKIDAWLRERP